MDNPLLTIDDFSQDPAAQWLLLKDARWDSRNKTLILASIVPGNTSAVWLRKNTTAPFTAEFSYYVGGGNSGNGFVFIFYKYPDYDPGAGRFLGFACRPDEKPCPQRDAPGYGVEWDTLYNNGAYNVHDPSPSHIALIKDNVNQHLAYVNTTIRDQWHNAKIIVKDNSLQVYVDQQLMLNWQGSFNKTYNRLGFGGASLVHYDWHLIDNVKIYGNNLTITGLQPRWTVELRSDTQQLSRATVPEGSHQTVLDTTGLQMPLRARLVITDEAGQSVYETSASQEIWGGDTLRLEAPP